MSEKNYLSDMFGVNFQRAGEIIEDIHIALYRDPMVLNEILFIDYLKGKYKGGELEFALYVGARASEKAVGPRTRLGKIIKAIRS